ncbi:hypothetical protein [Candidatus Nitrotoga sp. M5]|uniref:hypothetical protein n=1 Tax=Candidatus Nitrotoga sp. M5 TaxID=2890409 RepID=UPI001EF47BEE|nr:hypothetical protein [Candidatus Nitrotoga sp. M5]CAH1387913.1 hypothetical protein NTGM5_720030 [Candidatus Nitrotoga sp. M5]
MGVGATAGKWLGSDMIINRDNMEYRIALGALLYWLISFWIAGLRNRYGNVSMLIGGTFKLAQSNATLGLWNVML